jgi:hypothetical protein
MYACLAIATEDSSLTQSIERVVGAMGLDLKHMSNEDGSTIFLHPATRQTVRGARVFIAAVAPKNLQTTTVLNGIVIAQSGQVPIVLVGDDLLLAPSQGQIFGEIPPQNIFRKTSFEFPKDLEFRLRELAAVGSATGEGSSPRDGRLNVFMSYASEDKCHAEQLSKFLSANNISFWDYDRSRRKYDVDFEDEIDKAIRSSAVYVAILTPNWKRSQWVRDELKFARRLGKSNFVLEFEETDPIFSLSSLTVIDCKSDQTRGLFKFLARLDEILTAG